MCSNLMRALDISKFSQRVSRVVGATPVTCFLPLFTSKGLLDFNWTCGNLIKVSFSMSRFIDVSLTEICWDLCSRAAESSRQG